VQANSKGKGPTTPKRGRKAIFPLRTFFTRERCYQLSQRYRFAVYQNRNKGVEAMGLAVKAVFFHEQDCPGGSGEDRENWHQFCSDWCPYIKWVKDGNASDQYKPVKGGLLTNFKRDFEEAYPAVFQIFLDLGKKELMQRCTKALTQNINEAIHSKLWHYCRKDKNHSLPRFKFCARHTTMVHNHGHYAASMHHLL
ncbi:unnamed protein product, partial [Meganyctiphanes norvegica]